MSDGNLSGFSGFSPGECEDNAVASSGCVRRRRLERSTKFKAVQARQWNPKKAKNAKKGRSEYISPSLRDVSLMTLFELDQPSRRRLSFEGRHRLEGERQRSRMLFRSFLVPSGILFVSA